MIPFSDQLTITTLSVSDVNRLRSWGLNAREQLGEGLPGWTLEDIKLLDYLDSVLIRANEVDEEYRLS